MKLVFFLLGIIAVIFLQYDLLKPTLEVGLTPDDWSFIFWYKLFGSDPLSKIADVWAVRGPYTTVPLYYTGFIHSLVGFEYQRIQLIGILFKTLATLAIFPLIFIVFKNRLLAFFTTILFAMAYPASGALETAVEPSEYLGMFGMGLFLIAYYYIIKNNLLNWRWLGLTTILLIITIMLSVMRLYPLLILIPLTEVYLLIQKRSIAALRISFLRVCVLFSPFLILTLFRPSVILSYISVIPTVLLKVLEGNWHLALTPLQGIGYTLPINPNWWKIFGLVNINNFKDYLSFILGGPTVIFGLTILFLAFFTSTKGWRFFLFTLCLNFVLEILVYFIASHYLRISLESRLNFDALRIYSTLFGLFILVLSFAYWIEWNIAGRKNNLLLALWVGPAVSFVFVCLTWILAGLNLAFGQGAQDHYLMIPTVGISIFIGGLLVLAYEKAKKIRLRWLKNVTLLLIFIALTGFYLLNRNLIHSYFNHVNANGRSAAGQQMIQSRFREKIKNIDLGKPALFYFDIQELSGDGPFYTEGLLSPLPFFMRFQGNNLVEGCSAVFYESREKLATLIKERNGERGFVYKSLCVHNEVGSNTEVFYPPENFHAFKLKNKDFIDIREEVLKELKVE